MTVAEEPVDLRRWITLAVLLGAVTIVIVDNTVLVVAVPTIQEEFDTTLPSLQWVLSGYSLVFASLLIIGGRLGDLYGARRMFMIGAGLFGVGSLIASAANSVPQMVVGEAIIEGIGAALLMPATLGILSNTFRGPERATAFALWGTCVGAIAAFGPLMGGYFTTYHSWRWAFRVNVIVAPLAIIAALVLMQRDRSSRSARLDIPGALLIAGGTFALVFAFSQAPTYGWWRPLGGRDFTVIPLMLACGVLLTAVFAWLETRIEQRDGSPLFAPSQLRHLGFRYGLVTSTMISLGQFGQIFAIPIFLQRTKHLDAVHTGIWMLPFGIGILIGAQIAGWVARSIGPVRVVRIGITVEAIGLFVVAAVLTRDVHFATLTAAMTGFGIGVGMANAQLTNVILSDVDPDKVGVAGGANTTVRQIGGALGIAVVGSVLATASARWALVVSALAVCIGVGTSWLIPDEESVPLVAPLDVEPA
jgi:EmrB/QacA subfamily drug resistance transporter